MKQRKILSSFLLPLGDFLLVIGVFLLGYWLRHFILSDIFQDLLRVSDDFRLGLWHYVISGTVMGVIEIIMLQAFGVYRREYGLAKVEELAWILRSSFMAVIITFAFTFATRQLLFSRFVLLFAFPATSIAISIWHVFFHRMARRFALSRGKGIRVAVYGSGSLAFELAEFMEKRALVPYEIAGFVLTDRGENISAESVVKTFESSGGMFEWMRENRVMELIVADPELSRQNMASLIYDCEQEGIPYKLVADVFTLVSLTTRVVHMGGTIMIESVPSPLSGSRILLKRIIDLIITVPLILLLLPLGFLTATFIMIDTGLPVFYTQTRLGRMNRKFRMFKFRSMKVGAHQRRDKLKEANEAGGLLFKIRDDPRVTRVGRFIRKWSIDELPQLLNVITGDMSLAGPRPPLPEEVEEYSERHLKRLETVPGITGVWQVSGRSGLGFSEMVKLDLYYVDNWSIWMDLSILILTIPAIFSKEGAY